MPFGVINAPSTNFVIGRVAKLLLLLLLLVLLLLSSLLSSSSPLIITCWPITCPAPWSNIIYPRFMLETVNFSPSRTYSLFSFLAVTVLVYCTITTPFVILKLVAVPEVQQPVPEPTSVSQHPEEGLPCMDWITSASPGKQDMTNAYDHTRTDSWLLMLLFFDIIYLCVLLLCTYISVYICVCACFQINI